MSSRDQAHVHSDGFASQLQTTLTITPSFPINRIALRDNIPPIYKSDISVQLSPTGPAFTTCVDTGAANTIIHHNTLFWLRPSQTLLPLAHPCSFDSPGNGYQTITHCAALSLYVRAWRDGVETLIRIDADVLVSTLQMEPLLLGQDIIREHAIVPDAAREIITFGRAGGWQARLRAAPTVAVTWGGLV